MGCEQRAGTEPSVAAVKCYTWELVWITPSSTSIGDYFIVSAVNVEQCRTGTAQRLGLAMWVTKKVPLKRGGGGGWRGTQRAA